MYRDAEELIVEDTIQMTISYNPSLPGHTHTRGGGLLCAAEDMENGKPPASLERM